MYNKVIVKVEDADRRDDAIYTLIRRSGDIGICRDEAGNLTCIKLDKLVAVR